MTLVVDASILIGGDRERQRPWESGTTRSRLANSALRTGLDSIHLVRAPIRAYDAEGIRYHASEEPVVLTMAK